MSETDQIGERLLGDRILVIFDGHCGFCNRSVRWALVCDKHDQLRFVASESPKVAELLGQHGFSTTGLPSGPDTLLVVRNAGRSNEQLLVRSNGVLAMLRELPQPWPVLAALLSWIPRPLRDLGYRLIARWRYRIWGRLESCPIPTAEERRHFL